MKLKLPLTLLAALLACMSGISNAEPVVNPTDSKGGAVNLNGTSNYYIGQEVVWTKSHNYHMHGASTIISVGWSQGSGSLTVMGEDTVVNIGNNLNIGGPGYKSGDPDHANSGYVYVGAGATLENGQHPSLYQSGGSQLQIGSGGVKNEVVTGTLHIDGGHAINNHSTCVGTWEYSHGSLLVDNGGTMSIRLPERITTSESCYLYVGYYELSEGKIVVDNHSRLEQYTEHENADSAAESYIGLFGGKGVVEIKGGSTADLIANGSDGCTVFGYQDLNGSQASGIVTVDEGSTLRMGSTYIGYYGTGENSLTVSGGSTSTSEDTLYVGYGSAGTLTVNSGGKVEANSQLHIGYDGSSTDFAASASVEGEGSSLVVKDHAYIGEYEDGTLQITGGASASFEKDVVLGAYSKNTDIGQGEVTVSGAGSEMTVAGGTYVGNFGMGELHLSDGASYQTDYLQLAYDAVAMGEVTVDATSSLTVTGDLEMSILGGISSLTVADGGVLDMAGYIWLGAGAEITKSNLQLKQGQTIYLNHLSSVRGNVSAVPGSTVELGSTSISGTLTLSGAKLVLDSCTEVQDPLALLPSVGTLSMSGNSSELEIEGYAPTSIATGTYGLMSYTGSVNNLEGLTLAGTPADSLMTYTLQLDESNKVLQLVVAVKDEDSTVVVGGDQTLTEDSSETGKDLVIQGDDNNITVEGDVSLGSVVVQGSGDTTITATDSGSGSITGDTTITMNGTGSLTIDTPNSYTGGTTVNNGTVEVTVDGALGSGTVVVNDGGTLKGNDTTLSQELTMTGGEVNNLNGTDILKQGSDTATLSGSNTYSGTADVQGGTLQVTDVLNAADTKVAQDAELTLGDNATVTSDKLTIAGTVSGESSSTLNVAEIVMLDGANLTIEHTVDANEKLTVNEGNSSVGNLTLAADSETTLNKGAVVSVADGATLTISSGAVVKVEPDMRKLDTTTDTLLIIRGEVDNQGGTFELDETTQANYRNPEVKVTTDTAEGTVGALVKVDSQIIQWQNVDGAVWKVGMQSDTYWKALDSVEDRVANAQEENFFNDDIPVIDSDLVAEGEAVMHVRGVGEVIAKQVYFRGENETVLDGNSFVLAGDETTVTKKDSGSVTLSQANTYGGGTVIEAGTVRVENDEALGQGEVDMLDGSTLNVAEENKLANNVVIQAAEDAGTTANVTLVNPDGVKILIQQENTLVSFGDEETGSQTKTLAAGDVILVQSRVAAARYRAAGNARTALAPGQSIVWSDVAAGTSDSLTFAGGTLILDIAGSAYSVDGLTTIRNTATSTIDLSSWALDPASAEKIALVYCNGGLEGADYANARLRVALPEGMDAEELYARVLVEQNTNDPDNLNAPVLVLAFLDPEVNSELAATLSHNQRKVYNALCAYAAGKPAGNALDALAATVSLATAAQSAEVKQILDEISGEDYATMMSSQIEGNLAHLRRLRSHMGHGYLLSGSKSGLAAYANGYSELADVDADAMGPGYRRSEWGAEVGVEQEIAENAGIGLSLSAGRANVTPSGGLRYHEDSQNLDAYYYTRSGCWENRVSIGVGFHEHDLSRRGQGGALASAGDVSGTSFNFMEEISYRIPVSDDVTLRPFFAIESSVNDIDGFSESGDSLALVGDSQNAWATDLTLGLSCETTFDVLTRAPRATFELHAGVTASVGDTTSDLRMHFAGAPGYAFEQSSADRERWGMNLGAGLTVPVTRFTSVYATAEALFRGDSSSFDAQLGIHMNF